MEEAVRQHVLKMALYGRGLFAQKRDGEMVVDVLENKHNGWVVSCSRVDSDGGCSEIEFLSG
jgi:hypothetical protein